MPRQQPVITHDDKKKLRSELAERRGLLAPAERRRLSLAAAGQIIASARWRQAETVAVYMAMRGETSTESLLAHAWENGKTVLLPFCSRTEAGKMGLAACSGPDGLCPGLFAIPEPALSDEQREFLLSIDERGGNGAPASPEDRRAPSAPDLIVVPGLAFDCEGARLGMGGGYYDRLLALPRYRNSLRLGLAYSFQLVDRLPREAWDVPVHAVCTEKGIVWTLDSPPAT